MTETRVVYTNKCVEKLLVICIVSITARYEEYPKQEKLDEENYKFGLRNIFVHTPKRLFTCRTVLRHGTFPLYFSSDGRRAANFYRP
jgi:hypothetical protein